jgi:hypothetical protein
VAKSRRNDKHHDEERDARIDEILVRAKRLADRTKRLKKKAAKLRRRTKQKHSR